MKRMQPDTVLIVGASLGGCMAALGLARAGVPVVLLEKATFPRRKACGEGLSARGVAALGSAGFGVRKHCNEWAELHGYRLVHGARESILGCDEPLLGIKRASLDAALVEHVSSSRLVALREGAPVRSVEREGDSFRIQVGSEVLRTRSLIVADGAASGTAARLGCRAARRAVRRVGSSSAWRVIEGELQPWVQVFLFSRGEVYLTPTGKSSANVSLLGAPEFVSSLLPTEALSNWLVQHREKLGASFELESPALGAGPLNSFRLGAVLSGALLVGDACETFDPIGGMGMSHAVESGRLAAAAVVRGLTTGGFSEAAQWYESAQRSMAQEMRGFTRMTSWMLGTASGRVLMPWAVASGIAQRLSSAAHGAGKALPCRWLLGLAGAAA